MRSGKAETLCSTPKAPCKAEDFGDGIEGSSGTGGTGQVAVPCRASSGSDYPFEDLHHLVSEPEASDFSHAS